MASRYKQVVKFLEPQLLFLGHSGSSVELLQIALQELSLYSYRIDGYFGPKTASAVRQLQQQFGLLETSEFDMSTWYALTFWAEPTSRQSSKVLRCGRTAWTWPVRMLRPFWASNKA